MIHQMFPRVAHDDSMMIEVMDVEWMNSFLMLNLDRMFLVGVIVVVVMHELL
jgi:hypothetical protein